MKSKIRTRAVLGTTGALAIGSALSGLLCELLGPRTTLWLGGAVLATAFLPVYLSPLRTRRPPRVPEPEPEPEPTPGRGSTSAECRVPAASPAPGSAADEGCAPAR